MQFYIDADAGSSIEGWLAPDNPGSIPRIRVSVPGLDMIEMTCLRLRTDISDVGFHGTGEVGFLIDDSVVPDLASQSEIEIIDAETGIQIYRRNDVSRHIQRKVAYLDISMMPQNKIFRRINASFAMNYNFVEKHAFDTMICLINASYMKSMVMTGRPFLARYMPYFKKYGIFTSVLLNHPFEELAERMLFIQLLGKSNAAHLLPTFTTGVEALVPFVQSLNFDDDKALTLAFKGVKDEVRAALANPMTRLLGCNPGEDADRRHLNLALDNLSAVEIVGLRSQFETFADILSGLLGGDIVGDGHIAVSPAVEALAARLSRINAVQNLLEFDLALYSYAEDAVQQGLEVESQAH